MSPSPLMLQNYVMELLLTLETAVDYTTDEQSGDQTADDDKEKEVAVESTSVSPVPVLPQTGSNTVSHALSALDVSVMAAAATCPTQIKPSQSMCCQYHVMSCDLVTFRSCSFTDTTPTLSWSQYH